LHIFTFYCWKLHIYFTGLRKKRMGEKDGEKERNRMKENGSKERREEKKKSALSTVFLIRGFSRGAEGKCQGGDKRCLPLGSFLKGKIFGSTEDTPFLSEEIKRNKIKLRSVAQLEDLRQQSRGKSGKTRHTEEDLIVGTTI